MGAKRVSLSSSANSKFCKLPFLLTAILLVTILSPTVNAEKLQSKFDGAPLSENSEDAPITYSFSPAVRSAFMRASDLSQYTNFEIESATEWVVVSHKVMGEEINLLKDTYIVEVDSLNPSEYFHNLQKDGLIEVAYPLVLREKYPRWTPNDTYFSYQWHLENTGQDNGVAGEDVNITGAWNDVRGDGIVIGIVDDGLEWDHDDISANYEDTLDYDYCNYDDDPMPSYYDAHGTAAAGVAAAVGDNGLGVSGSAPNASLAGLMLIACSNSDNDEANALSHLNNDIDIYSNSWGPSDDGDILGSAGPLMLAAFEDDAYNGRNGLGNIITWAAGNGLSNDDDSNLDAYANSRFTISVTAVDHDGDQTNYGEPGANVLIASPSDGSGVGITTTDNAGNAGYTSGDYTSNFGGTSSATPLVSGIIALMLDANPNLTWRDVQQILAESARKNDPNDSGWSTNGAGLEFNHKYGFGVVDAGHAVSLANNWTNLGPEVNLSSGRITVAQTIPDNAPSSPVVSSFNFSQSITVESVEVIFDADHPYRSDLDVTLISPDGTESELVNYFANRDNGNDYNNWLFTSVQHWGESSQGTWTLEVYDDGNQDEGTWNHWEIIVHGSEIDLDSDGDGITDSNETLVYFTDPNNPDTDSDGLSDYEEIFTFGTNATDADTDDDFLLDGVEINVNYTDPFNNDTDSDGLSDGLEVLNYFTDPLTPDEDADSDSYYWFQDCNDSNPNIYPTALELLNGIDDDCDSFWDEGFNQTDSDSDNLSDYSEYHTHLTNYSEYDTDGDLLSDGDEVLIYLTNPLVKDNDSDTDGYYWFEDCNDNNSSINPSAAELLDGVDNNCRDGIDEDFIGQDSDEDGLLDLFEFNNLTTDPFDSDSDSDGLIDGYEFINLSTNPLDDDSDNDGLLDGEEVLETFTDPLSPDLDEDLDGYRWFEECDDTNPDVNPDEREKWNAIDDNCNGEIDELIDRNSRINQSPKQVDILLNATSDSLYLEIDVNLPLEDKNRLNLTVTWMRNGTQIATGYNFSHPAYNCENPTAELAFDLCNHTGFVGPWIYTAVISDGSKEVYFVWYVSYEVWQAPDEKESEAKDASSEIEINPKQILFAGFGVLIIVLLSILIFRRNKPPKEPTSMFSNPRYEQRKDPYAVVPSAPSLPPPPGAFRYR